MDGVHTYNQAQQRSLLDGKVKLDRDGKYSVGFHFSSGRYFDWAYADFIGGGTDRATQASIPRLASMADRLDAIASGPSAVSYPSGGWSFVPRQLYFSAKPWSDVDFQYGSIGINRGVNTEITSYDEDGYMAGGRILLSKPKSMYFDEVSVTYAYLGDIQTPNFFRPLSAAGAIELPPISGSQATYSLVRGFDRLYVERRSYDARSGSRQGKMG